MRVAESLARAVVVLACLASGVLLVLFRPDTPYMPFILIGFGVIAVIALTDWGS